MQIKETITYERAILKIPETAEDILSDIIQKV